MDLTAIRSGLAASIRALPGVTVYKTPPGTVNAPAVVIHSGEPMVEYHTANAKGLATLRLNVSVLVSRQDDQRAADALDGYLSSGTGADRSLIDAIEADRTLGGTIDSLLVESASGPFANTDGGSNFAAATLELVLYARRN